MNKGVTVSGHKLKAIRMRQALSVADLAEKASVGKRTIIRYEQSANISMAYTQFRRLSKALAVDHDALSPDPDPEHRPRVATLLVTLQMPATTHETLTRLAAAAKVDASALMLEMLNEGIREREVPSRIRLPSAVIGRPR